MIFGNTGNLGLPLALFAFGDEGLSYAVVVFAIMASGRSHLESGWSPEQAALAKYCANHWSGPHFWARFFCGKDWQTPTFLTNTLELIGQMAIPLMLITLGVAVARLTRKALGAPLFLSVIKLICVRHCVGCRIGLRPGPCRLWCTGLQVATPVAVTSYLLAEKYGADAEAVAGLVVVSTLMSVGALPLLLAVCCRFSL